MSKQRTQAVPAEQGIAPAPRQSTTKQQRFIGDEN